MYAVHLVLTFRRCSPLLWELSLGFWMTFKGFKPSPITEDRVSLTLPARDPLPIV